ncbi:unnamed protein product [Gadus morhua 'NCC']
MNPATRNGSPSLRSREREVAICPVVCCLTQSQRLPPLLDSCQEDPSVRWRASASLHPYSDERNAEDYVPRYVHRYVDSISTIYTAPAGHDCPLNPPAREPQSSYRGFPGGSTR